MTLTAKEKILSIKQRLEALVDNRAYVFKDTPVELAEHYLYEEKHNYGMLPEEVEAFEQKSGGKFSNVFREYLLEFAASPGDLFTGSDIIYPTHEQDEFHSVAKRLIDESAHESFLGDADFIFLFHQGYSFMNVRMEGGEDSPVYQYTEGQSEPKKVANTFFELLEKELVFMEESNNEERETGGCFLIVTKDGITREYPAMSSGIRPLDVGDVFPDTPSEFILKESE